jgi:hypothetical protein
MDFSLPVAAMKHVGSVRRMLDLANSRRRAIKWGDVAAGRGAESWIRLGHSLEGS